MPRLFLLLVALAALSSCRTAVGSEGTVRPGAGFPPGTPSASKAAVLAFLGDQYGKAIISGQMDLTWNASTDMVDRVFATTGKYPALVGFDLMDYTKQGTMAVDADGQTTEALAWWNNAKGTGKNGLVQFNWHWRDPSGATNSFYKYGYSGGGVGSGLHIPLKNGQFDPTTTLGMAMKADMDFVAEQLKVLADAGVPILWRPLHEGGGSGAADGSGAWFWWGQDGAPAYVALYRYMYDLFTRVHGLNNLIWVWNGQGEAYYPGDDAVDLGGQDVYDKNHSSQKAVFTKLRQWTGNKMVALTEVGAMPDPDNLVTDQAWFSWFMVWNDNPTVNLAQAQNNFWSGSGSATEDSLNYPWNTPTLAKKVYGHPFVVTLDELPRLSP